MQRPRPLAKDSSVFLDARVREVFNWPWEKARQAIRRGKIRVGEVTITDPRTRVSAADPVHFDAHARPKPLGPLPTVVYLDGHVVVVNKPSGMSTIPYEREHGTLDEWVRGELSTRIEGKKGRPALGVVHRIDKETSGLVVFTRTWLAKSSLTSQFREHSVHRRYVALVYGFPKNGTIESHLVEDRGDGLRGSWELHMGRKRPRLPPQGQRAMTHIWVLERFTHASLIECRLETGRTHQIRIHLSESGHPLIGERVYIRSFRGAQIESPRMMLHAAELGFRHPKTEEPVQFAAHPPIDFRDAVERAKQT